MRLGWREWFRLPELSIPAIKTKIDTGARTSALHASHVEPGTEHGAPWVRFQVRPMRRLPDLVLSCYAPVTGQRVVTDSGGHKLRRYFIVTRIVSNDAEWEIELSLADRGEMLFPMLLGRKGVPAGCVVDPARSYLRGKRARNEYIRMLRDAAQRQSA